MSKFTGNIIRLPAVTPTQNSASGVYTLDDQFTAQSSGTWPIVRDQYFNYTTLLLTGAVQGTAYPNPVTQPYSFLSDASTNNFVVSPNGDVSARPFNPYLNNYSNYFGGSPSYLSGSGQLLGVGSNNFTVEAWIFLPSFGATYQIIGTSTTSSSPTGIYFGINPSGALFAAETWGINVWTTTGLTFSAGTWNHVALCRSGTTARIFLNGIQASNTGTFNESYNSTLFVVGRTWTTDAANSNYMVGNISNLRVISGQALYSGNFTPPALPFTATTVGSTGSGAATSITGTVTLLTCQDNRFKDNSPSNRTITANGTPAVSQNSPFVSYDTTNGSGYFDGTGDYFSWPSGASVAFGTGDFTVEMWAYQTSISSSYYIDARNASQTNAWAFLNGLNAVGDIGWFNGTSALVYSSVANAPKTNQWNHLVYVRSGTTGSIFVNGVRVATATDSTNYTTSPTTSYVACRWAVSDFMTGYLSSLRIVKGTAVYDPTQTTITVPTAPLQAVTNTSLLTCQTRAPATNNGFIDSSPNNFVVTRNGNTTQGSFSPFSLTGWANYFDGVSGTYLSVPRNSVFLPGANVDFTFEAWVYLTATPGAENAQIMGLTEYGTDSDWLLVVNSSLQLALYFGVVFTLYTNTTQALTLNTWCHVAASRSGTAANNLKLFVNGVGQSFSQNATTVSTGSRNLSIGADQDGTESRLTGYISNIRIINGQGLYTGNFTPPTAALTATSVGTTGTNVATSITGTVGLITCQSNRFKDNSANNFTVTPNNGVSVQAFSPFAPAQSYIPSQIGGSGYFDGNADYLTWSGSSVGSGAFTFECWFYYTGSFSGTTAFIGPGTATTNALSIAISNSTTIQVDQYGVTATSFTVPTMTANQWYHLAVVRNSGGSCTVFLNGARSSTGAVSITTNFANVAAIGYVSSAVPRYWIGYLAGVVYNLTALYDPTQTTITIPTAPPTAIPNTSLLLNFTNGGIVDATGKNNLETVGNSGVQTTVIKYGNGSMYFDGTSDYLLRPYSDLLNINSGDFTIEAWVYPTVNKTFSTVAAMWGTSQQSWIFDINNGVAGFAWQANSISVNFLEAGSVSLNVWSHLAVTRAGNTFKLFVNGTQTASSTSSNNSLTTIFIVGAYDSGASGNFAGYISNLRITKGVARYTSNFNTNLPSGPFPLG